MSPQPFSPVPDPDKVLAEQFSGLPQEIQKALSSDQVVNALQEIGRTHELHLDKVEALLDAVTECLTGSLRPDKFSAEIASRLGISSEKARNIADEVNSRVFSAIHEAMKQLYPAPDLTVGHPEINQSRPSAASALSSISTAPAEIPQASPAKKIDPYREPIE